MENKDNDMFQTNNIYLNKAINDKHKPSLWL